MTTWYFLRFREDLTSLYTSENSQITKHRNLPLLYYFSEQLVPVPVLSIIFFKWVQRENSLIVFPSGKQKFMRQCRLKHAIRPHHVGLLSEVGVNVVIFSLCIFTLIFLLLFSTLVPLKLSKFLKLFYFKEQGNIGCLKCQTLFFSM